MFDTLAGSVSAAEADARFAALVERVGDDLVVDLDAAPGPGLAGLLAAVAADPGGLGDAEVLDGIAAAARVEAWAAALRLRLVGAASAASAAGASRRRRRRAPCCFRCRR